MHKKVLMLVAATALAVSSPVSASASPGDLDGSFGGDGRVTTHFDRGGGGADVLVQPDGRVVAAGWEVVSQRDNRRFALVRYKRSGKLDRSFGKDGRVTTQFKDRGGYFAGGYSYANAVALQTDARIVAAGRDYTAGGFALSRYLPNGALDTSFGGDGRVTTGFGHSSALAYDVAVGRGGKIVAAGQRFPGCGGDDSQFALARYRRNGSLDPTFGGDGKVVTEIGGGCHDSTAITALVIQDDGKIVAAGTGNLPGLIVARYLPNGDLDPGFGDGVWRPSRWTRWGDSRTPPTSSSMTTAGSSWAARLAT